MDDLIEVLLNDDLDHLIYKPRQVFIDQEAVLLKSLEVIDEDGVRQIIKACAALKRE
jgi:Flp pilus assembly CpaF family ATPase